MKFLLYSLLAYISIVLCLSDRNSRDYRVKSKTGKKLALYTDVYYNIINKGSRNMMFNGNQVILPSFQPNNGSYWWKIVKLYGKDRNSYQLQTFYGRRIYCYFERADDDSYYIYHQNSEYPLYDPNADYLSQLASCIDCDQNNDITKWKFEEMPDYKLNAIMTDFKLEVPTQEMIKSMSKPVSLLRTSILINNSSATITEVVRKKVKKTQTFRISFSKSISESSKYFSRFSISSYIGGYLFGIGASAETNTDFSLELTERRSDSNSLVETLSNEVTFDIKKTVNIPPNQRVKILSYVNWIENFKSNYEARIIITGRAPRFMPDHELDSHTIKILLNKYGFGEKLIGYKPNQKVIDSETKGVLIASFGLDSVSIVTSS